MRLLLLFMLLSPCYAWADGLESSIMRVYSYVQRPDYDSPWANKTSERLTHLGLLVDENSLLVSAYAVRSGKHFEAEKIGDSKRYPLQVKYADPIMNLALLEFVEGAPDNRKPLNLGDDLEIGATCTLFEAGDGETLLARTLRLREVELKPGVLSDYMLPLYSLEIRKAGYGWFEPLIRGGKLVGAAVSQSGSTVYALPASLIRRFLDELKKEKYRGFPELGISFSPLLAPALRQYAKATDVEDGVWIQDIKRTSAFADGLQAGDILLEVDNTRVSARGTYEHPLWGRLSIIAKLSEYFEGDDLDIKILRDGKIVSISRQLKAYDPTQYRIPTLLDDEPKYLIFGGLLLQELTEDLLQSWGRNWQKRAPLPYLMEDNFRAWPSSDGQARIVVLQRVLPLDFNKGYHDFEDYFVSEVNGQPIQNLNDVAKALHQPEKAGFARFSLQPGDEEIILSTKNLSKVHSNLRERYGIKGQAQFWEPELVPEKSK